MTQLACLGISLLKVTDSTSAATASMRKLREMRHTVASYILRTTHGSRAWQGKGERASSQAGKLVTIRNNRIGFVASKRAAQSDQQH